MKPRLLFLSLITLAPCAWAATEMPSRFNEQPSNMVTVGEPAPSMQPTNPEPPPPPARPQSPSPIQPSEPIGANPLQDAPIYRSAEGMSAPVHLRKPGDVEDMSVMLPEAMVAGPQAGEALVEALSYVYEHNPQLLAEREKVKAVDEQMALAVSDFRPDIRADASRGRERSRFGGGSWDYGDTKNRGLTVTQPLFSGFDGIAGLKSAKERVKAARADLIALEQQLFFNTVVAYTGLAEAQSVVDLTHGNVEVLAQQQEATSVRFDVGELTRTDVSQADARLAAARASEQQALGDLAIARAEFARIVGYPAPGGAAMVPVPPNLPKSLPEASEQAKLASPVLEAAKHREKAFASDVNVRAGGILPDLNLQGTMRRSEGGNAFINQYDNDAITLNLSIPLYQSGAEWSRLREAKKLAAQAKYNTIDAGFAVEQDVNSAWQNYVTAASVISSSEAASQAAGLALEGVREESDFGVRTVLDVLDAEQEYLDAKVNVVRAVRNHKIQAYRLLASVGRLTAKELMLPVKLYDPQENYDDVKYQLLGW